MTAPVVFSVENLATVLREQLSVEQNSTVYIAYSGGVDSHVLLHALSCLATDYPLTLRAIHIDHSLHTRSAEWAEHCRRVCADLAIPLTIKTVSITPQKGESLEAAARNARYAALAQLLPEHGICMTAQHMDDQSETVFLQLLRGAGVHGLAAMPASRAFADGCLLRPLLGYRRKDLVAYARAKGLNWREDPSNEDNRFDRNYLRNQVLPLMRERWPGMDKSLSRSTRHMASAVSLLDEVALQDLIHCQATENHFFPGCMAYLRVDHLVALPSSHQLNALRCWVRLYGMTVPGDERLHSLLSLLVASPERGEVMWQSGTFRLHSGMLWLCDKTPLIKIFDHLKHWDPMAPLQLNHAGVKLSAHESAGEGIAKAIIATSELDVTFRQGGEVCRMPGKHGSKPLKTLLQDLGVPPWLRSELPLIYIRGELIAVASLWHNPHYLPAEDEAGYVFSFQQA